MPQTGLQVEASWIQLTVPDPIPFGPGCPPGSLGATFPTFPDLGPSPYCPSGTCGNAVPQTPLLYRWQPLCSTRANAAAPTGTTPDFANLVLNQTTAMLLRWRAEVWPITPGLT